ncbi:hypothetical protein R5R35_003276 [Gryllus longicercus]|uniref:Nose resistant-to-fluoxetine protein N-terminal domain-containing protein n=1 Tax=Gryllus longicercus TaxID=2509291 RepID=A0AAN9VY88_9ORTH
MATAFGNGSVWAVKMFDSSTKIPDGLLYGNLVHMGNFDECLSVRKGDSGGPEDFDGQHCLVALEIPSRVELAPDPSDELSSAAHAVEGSRIFVGKGRQAASAFSGLSLQVAWCTPSTCSAEEVGKIANAAASLVGLKASVAPSECHARKQLRALDVFAICLLVFFIACAAASTAYDVLTQHRVQRRMIFLAFSVYSNWPKLISITSGRDQLASLNGIRTISMGWVVLGHVYLLNVISPTLNIAGYAPDFMKSFERLYITNATVSVDSFFMMSGVLLSFLFLKEVERTNHFNVVKFYVHRYVRLTPALAIVLLLTVSLLNFMGTGPLWNTVYDYQREACEQNWWTNLLYVNNFVHTDKMCLGHTWYLAVDMQLFWLSPLVLLPLWKLPRCIALSWSSLLLLVGWAVPFTIVYVKELTPLFAAGGLQTLFDTMKYYYWPVYTRYVPWLLGVLLGYILREARKEKPELSRWQILLGWTLSTVLMLAALYGAYPFQQPTYVYNGVEIAFWLSLFRVMWSLGLGWIIFACDQGYGGIVNTILSWSFFQPLSRLCYGVYLLHFPILEIYSGVIQSPIYLADINVIPQFFGMLLMSGLWTIPMVLLFESPIIFIEKSLIGAVSGRQREPEVEYRNLENHEVEDQDSAHG